MAVVVYSNGITEDYKPSELVFTEEELVKLFTEFPDIKTVRIPTILNTWCIFGSGINDPMEFNRIVSDIVKEAVYSHALFVHDSEINPDWKATDSVLYKGYSEFIGTMKRVIDDVAANIVNELAATEEYEDKVDHLPQLETLGATPDKRIMFLYNPDDQTKSFYNNDEFSKFSKKVYDYISANHQIKEPFTLYADKKAVIIVERGKVEAFLSSILEDFKKREEYEICTNITKMIDEWIGINKDNSKPAKKNRRLKSKDE
jgi:hypothetical protein